jgi:hypothetical protein
MPETGCANTPVPAGGGVGGVQAVEPGPEVRRAVEPIGPHRHLRAIVVPAWEDSVALSLQIFLSEYFRIFLSAPIFDSLSKAGLEWS